jgi:hypothetical protein
MAAPNNRPIPAGALIGHDGSRAKLDMAGGITIPFSCFSLHLKWIRNHPVQQTELVKENRTIVDS